MFVNKLRNDAIVSDNDSHPVQTVAHLMKLSFDEGHRHAICQLGGINVIANLIEVIYFLLIVQDHVSWNVCAH